MVENPGKTLRPETFKPVNTPVPVQVEIDDGGFPAAVRLPRRQTVIDIEDRWRIDDEWWRPEPVARLYFGVRLASGQRLVLYHDLAGDCWYRQSY